MANKQPFNTSFSGNIPVYTADTASFITGATNSPTPNTGSYVRWQRVGTIVQIEYKYIFATVPTTGAMSINLPVPISTDYPKPQSIFHIRYFNSPGTGQVHYGFYNEKNVNSVNLVAQTTFGGVPGAFTNLAPNTLVVGDILTGLIVYETS
jgi:hypothetical protein